MIAFLRAISLVLLGSTITNCSPAGFGESGSGLSAEASATSYNQSNQSDPGVSQSYSKILKSAKKADADDIFALYVSPPKPKPGQDYYLIIEVDKSRFPTLNRAHITGSIAGTDGYDRTILALQKPDEGFLSTRSMMHLIIPIPGAEKHATTDRIQVYANGPAWNRGELKVEF